MSPSRMTSNSEWPWTPNGRTPPPEVRIGATHRGFGPGCVLGCVLGAAAFLLVAAGAVKLFRALSRALGGPV
jgi:hypothetical protein